MLFTTKEIELLKNHIPQLERVKPSLISILKAHSETNISNLLAYFLRGEDYPQLQEIFFDALMQKLNVSQIGGPVCDLDIFTADLLEEGYKSVKVQSEYATKFGRIDILITIEDKKGKNRRAIIIENKLYHEFNNDFDDYFYSVCEQENISPDNVIIVVLSLKKYTHVLPSYMTTYQVTHRDLKSEVVKALPQIFDNQRSTSSTWLVDEYIMHINDLYMDNSTYANEKSFEYYINNQEAINSIAKKVNDIDFANFNKKDISDKQNLYVLKSKIERALDLRSRVKKFALDTFKHYITLTERGVQGKNYFRGKGLAYDAIRYKLIFDDPIVKEDEVGLEVSLDGSVLTSYGITISDSEIQSVLSEIGVSTTAIKTKNDWFKIYTEQHDIYEVSLENILKESLDNRWGKVEKVLINKIKVKRAEEFNKEVITFLSNKGGFSYIEIEDNNGRFVQFSHHLTEGYYQYRIRLLVPDLIEVILYVRNTFWEETEESLKGYEEFIKFTKTQSYTIEELKDESLDGQASNYDAILKKSYRIKPQDNISNLFEKENPKWVEMEKLIIRAVEDPT